MNVDYLCQSRRNGGKLAVAENICVEMGITLNEVAYIGDDINCVELLLNVGLAACPVDAQAKVKSIPGIKIMTKKGGEGCVREFIEMII